MGQCTVPTWIRWIREEGGQIVSELEDEIQRRMDPDDPFDGTASGIFQQLEHDPNVACGFSTALISWKFPLSLVEDREPGLA